MRLPFYYRQIRVRNTCLPRSNPAVCGLCCLSELLTAFLNAPGYLNSLCVLVQCCTQTSNTVGWKKVVETTAIWSWVGQINCIVNPRQPCTKLLCSCCVMLPKWTQIICWWNQLLDACGCSMFTLQNSGNTRCLTIHYNGITWKIKIWHFLLFGAVFINVKPM